jgi:hypothetical protein
VPSKLDKVPIVAILLKQGACFSVKAWRSIICSTDIISKPHSPAVSTDREIIIIHKASSSLGVSSPALGLLT